jgi:hypothetical protein
MRAIKFTFAGDAKASDTMYSVLYWSVVALLAAWCSSCLGSPMKRDMIKGKSQHSDPPFLRNPVGADRGEKGVHHVN